MIKRPGWTYVRPIGTVDSLYKVDDGRRTRYVTTNGVVERWFDTEREAYEHHDFTRPGLPGLGD